MRAESSNSRSWYRPFSTADILTDHSGKRISVNKIDKILHSIDLYHFQDRGSILVGSLAHCQTAMAY